MSLCWPTIRTMACPIEGLQVYENVTVNHLRSPPYELARQNQMG
jgi:hypothetical protein